jgi:putative PIG3 family NAD(P)H quinone oxidoreductase
MPRVRGVRIRAPGDVDVLDVTDIDVREPGPGELLVDVAAAGLNRADVLQRRGLYPAPPGIPADVPGLEYSGTVAALGTGVTEWRAGDRVMGIVGGGAMARQLVTSAREALPVPEGLDLREAAAVPEAFLTAWDALVRQGELREGEVTLLHSVGSGVGTAALQLARLAGALVVGTSRTPEKLSRCRALGLEMGIHLPAADREHPARFAATLQRLTGGRLADVILDTVGAAYLEENVASLARRGRLVVIGLLGGAMGHLPLGRLLGQRGRVFGSVLRGRSPDEKAELAAAFRQQVLPHFGTGALRPVVDAVLPMEQVREAHRRMDRNETFGKIVLAW